jgi:ribonuclease VapC
MEAEVAVVPFADAHWKAAIDAHRRYGKGRHPAGLNFGDCLTYATAKLAGQPLLCTGRDFARTDLPIA